MSSQQHVQGAKVHEPTPPQWPRQAAQAYFPHGLMVSLFTAVFFTRLLFDVLYMGRRRLQAISI